MKHQRGEEYVICHGHYVAEYNMITNKPNNVIFNPPCPIPSNSRIFIDGLITLSELKVGYSYFVGLMFGAGTA
jgi:hypothetical protein